MGIEKDPAKMGNIMNAWRNMSGQKTNPNAKPLKENAPSPVQNTKQKVMTEEAKEPVSLKNLKESYSGMTKKQMQQRTFQGNATQCMTKLDILFNGGMDAEGNRLAAKSKPNLINVEEIMGGYKITYEV